ncbi:hypothetical protein ACPOL_5276 [Acidisarcina polymorpha]|uniref:Uncharacterized protein n=1 Tax=Acidisarcina polymorpha TaxID=2211140 RepID=A0A2Z5G607_9BACT|nr:hypothetical protein ACPOL_5276 [Acidisarcina polymorpha]
MVGELVGWSKNSMVDMSKHYCHPDDDSKTRAVEAAANSVGNGDSRNSPPLFPGSGDALNG